jgi:hypothetical protein
MQLKSSPANWCLYGTLEMSKSGACLQAVNRLQFSPQPNRSISAGLKHVVKLVRCLNDFLRCSLLAAALGTGRGSHVLHSARKSKKRAVSQPVKRQMPPNVPPDRLHMCTVLGRPAGMISRAGWTTQVDKISKHPQMLSALSRTPFPAPCRRFGIVEVFNELQPEQWSEAVQQLAGSCQLPEGTDAVAGSEAWAQGRGGLSLRTARQWMLHLSGLL